MQIGRGVWRKRTPLSPPEGYLDADEGERRVMELKLALAHWIWSTRCQRSMSQAQLGELVGSNQARISTTGSSRFIGIAGLLYPRGSSPRHSDAQLAQLLDLERSGRAQHVRKWATRRMPPARLP